MLNTLTTAASNLPSSGLRNGCLVGALLLAGLAGCGNKGDLYLPKAQATPTPTVSPTPTPPVSPAPTPSARPTS